MIKKVLYPAPSKTVLTGELWIPTVVFACTLITALIVNGVKLVLGLSFVENSFFAKWVVISKNWISTSAETF